VPSDKSRASRICFFDKNSPTNLARGVRRPHPRRSSAAT